MLIFDLKFIDGKACRYLCPDPEATEATERASLEAIFCGRLTSMARIIAPPPEKLPWKRMANDRWEMSGFKLYRCADESKGKWCLAFLDKTVYAKESAEVSAVVRSNWANVC